MAFDLLVKGGTVVTPMGRFHADVGVRGEKIVAVGQDLGRLVPAKKTIDATGHYVLPGLLDVHVHFELPFMGSTSADDYVSGTRAAARGGVTTTIDFAIPYQKPDGTYESLSEAADNWHRRAEGKALTDYTFHIALTHWPTHQNQIREMVGRGFSTFKEFMIYEAEGWQSDDRALYGTLEQMADLGSMLLVHAESPVVLDELIARNHVPEKMKKLGAQLHALTRPNFIEYEAIERCVTWSAATGGQLYIVHMSTSEGCDIIAEARAGGVPVLAETCPQYLVLDDSVFKRKDGHLYACCPQVKTTEDSARLWKGLAEGSVSVVSTDTCTFTRKQKGLWKGDWTKIPMGLPGVETMAPIVYTRGVLKELITLEQMVDRLSASPAKIMGLYPRKGRIAPGSDADLAIIHPRKTFVVDPETLETNCDWSPYEGWKLAGFARTTISRGEVIVDDYKVVGRQGRGVWLPRKTAGLEG